MMNKLRDSWETPAWLFNWLNGPCKFTLDAAATEQNKKCDAFCEDGLSDSWTEQVFCNPPYGDIMPWLKKAVHEIEIGNCTRAVFVLPADLSSRWGEFVVNNAKQIVFLVGGRVQFVAPKGVKPSSNTKGTMIAVFARQFEFSNVFGYPFTEYYDIKQIMKANEDKNNVV